MPNSLIYSFIDFLFFYYITVRNWRHLLDMFFVQEFFTVPTLRHITDYIEKINFIPLFYIYNKYTFALILRFHSCELKGNR